VQASIDTLLAKPSLEPEPKKIPPWEKPSEDLASMMEGLRRRKAQFEADQLPEQEIRNDDNSTEDDRTAGQPGRTD
jgi:hypothetical protein